MISDTDKQLLSILNLEEPDLSSLEEAVYHAKKLLESAVENLEKAKTESKRREHALDIIFMMRSAGFAEDSIKSALLAQFGRVKTKTNIGPKPPTNFSRFTE